MLKSGFSVIGSEFSFQNIGPLYENAFLTIYVHFHGTDNLLVWPVYPIVDLVIKKRQQTQVRENMFLTF